MPQMPNIEPDVNKEPPREKKKPGLFARLFGGGGASGGGAGGFGGNLGSAAASGGLMATKASILGFVLAGTTVAGGIGLVGYRLFGPGQADQVNDGSNLQLFAPRPKDAAGASSAPAAPKDGSSKSLSMVAQANSSPKAPETSADGAVKDATAASAADASAATSNASMGQVSSGNGVNKNLLKGGGKFGALSSGFGGGGGSASSGGGAAAGRPGEAGGAAASSKSGKYSAMAKNTASAGGTARGISSRKAGGASRQLMAVGKDQRGATTSYSAGRTYDGNSAGNGDNGPGSGAINIGGGGDGAGAQAKSMPNSAQQVNKQEPPPTPPSHDVTPWGNAIKQAQMLLMIGALILLILSQIKSPGPWKWVLGGIVMAMGLAIIALGAQISGGKYGQKAQGGVLAAAGIGLSAAAAMAMAGGDDKKDTGNTNTTKTTETTKVDGNTTTKTTETTGPKAEDKGLFGGINPYVLVGGGAVLIGTIGTSMVPPKTYPSKDFQNGNPPDSHWFGYQEAPSQAALRKYLA